MLNRTLQLKKDAVAKRWLQDIYGTYAPETAKFLKRVKDPFSNPVGHTLITSTAAICDQICGDEMDADTVCTHLVEIIKVRAVQDMSPAQALSFVFLFKAAARVEIGNDVPAATLEILDHRVDQTALFAFDIYTKCREQMYQLRNQEMQRHVSVIIDKFNKENCGVDPDPENESGDGQTPQQQPIARCET